MEAAPCTQEVSGHAVSLLASLNLQRDQAQFCDCVVRQRQSPAQLYPAHRSVLAASSPVLASLLSSTGALVELQAPCLSDSVLPLVLDYIYTGALPTPIGQQQYCSLFTAACHLQMDELQEALRARQWTEVNPDCTGADNQFYSDNINTHSKSVKQDHQYSADAETCDETQMHLANTDSCIKRVERATCRSSSTNAVNCCSSTPGSTVSSVNTCSCIQVNRLVQQDLLHYLPSTAEGQEVLRRSKEEQKEQCHSAGSVEQEEGQGSREEVLVRTMEERRRRSPYSPHTEVQEKGRSRATEQLRSPDTSKPEEVLRNREGEDEKEDYSLSRHRRKTQEEFQDSPFPPPFTSLPPVYPSRRHHRDDGSPSQHSSSSSSSSPRSCGAVPVICHSNRATMLRPAEAPAPPPLHPASQASASIIRSAIPQPASPGEGIHSNNGKNTASVGIGITAKGRSHFGTQKWNYSDSSDHCGIQNTYYKPSTDQYEMLQQDYVGSNTGHFGIQNDEHDCMDYGLPQMTDYSGQFAHYGSVQSDNETKHPRDDGISQDKGYRDYKYNTDLGLDEFPSKQHREECTDCQDVSMATAEEKQDFHCLGQRSGSGRAVTSRWGEEEGDSHSSRYTAEMDRLDSCSNLYGLKTNRNDNYSSLHRAEKNRTDTASSSCRAESHCSQRKTGADNRDNTLFLHTALTDRRDSADICLYASTTSESTLDDVTHSLSASDQPEREEGPAEPHPSEEFENISDAEITEPNATFTMPVASDTYDPADSVVGHSYRGHLHYHCLSQEHTHLSHTHSEHKHFDTSHLIHLHPDHPDQSSDGEGIATCSSLGPSPLGEHYTRGTNQVLLLDISTKPAELLVSHRAGDEEKGVGFGRGGEGEDTGETGNDSKHQWNEAKFVAGVDETEIRARSKFGAGTLDEAETKSWVGEKRVGERRSVAVGRHQEIGVRFGAGAGAEVGHEAVAWVGEEAVSTGAAASVDGASLTTSLPSRVPPSVPDCVPASMSSTLPVCVPSTLSVCMPSSVPAHLSTPVHHTYQCSLCDRSFSQRGSLNRHMRSHLGVRPYPCPRCPMTFSRQYRVTEHMRVHQRCAFGEDHQKNPASSL